MHVTVHYQAEYVPMILGNVAQGGLCASRFAHHRRNRTEIKHHAASEGL